MERLPEPVVRNASRLFWDVAIERVDPELHEDFVPEKKLSVADIAAIYRDSYEGTEFDLTRGSGAGPFGTPVRYDVNPDKGDTWDLEHYTPEGAWERPISIYRCGVLWINQAKGQSGSSWIGLDRPATSCLMPFCCTMKSLPDSIQKMNLLEFEFGVGAWWAFNFVANYLSLNYAHMMKELQSVRRTLEPEAFAKIAEALASGNMQGVEDFCLRHADEVVRRWWSLATTLVVRYNDGCITTGPSSIMKKIDYPKPWLREAGFFDGPVRY
jgi:dipeptidase